MTQEILPPLPPLPATSDPTEPRPGRAQPYAEPHIIDHAPDALDEPIDLIEFTPVPRAAKRWNGITAMKQRVFMDNLAASGCVKMASDSIGTSTSAMYTLRKSPGAESFAAAWDKAIEAGARRVLDMLMSHAIHGTPETLRKGDEVILERRKYNTRAMMWIVQQRFPEQYGGNLNVTGNAPNSMPHSIQRMKDQWRKEWEAERKQLDTATEAETNAAIMKKLRVLQRRNWYKEFVPWMDDPEKRAACEVLHGPQDWEAIREAAAHAARNGG